jgi:hypothetical protein
MTFLTHLQSRASINATMADAGYATPRFNQKEVRQGPDEYGALVFGPKLGRYILGLHGLELTSEDTTVDKWIVRMYRRWTGRLFETPVGDQGIAERPATEPLPDLYEVYPSSVGPNPKIVAAKQAYLDSIGVPYRRQARYVKADPARGKRIADAFDAMEHAPADPATAAAYRAMIDETIAQYHSLVKELGLKIEFIKPGQEDPYRASPRMALQDVIDNGHLWVFPTQSGFGTVNEISDNPLLEPTGIVVDGHSMVANDVFRIVHDIYGHGPEGAGFGPSGEENAWQSHVRMYSPLAARAMTTETRGQNSWVNFGPHGEALDGPDVGARPRGATCVARSGGLHPDRVGDPVAQVGRKLDRRRVGWPR